MCRAYESLRCLDLQVWQVLHVPTTDDKQTDYFTPCACAHNNKVAIASDNYFLMNLNLRAQATPAFSVKMFLNVRPTDIINCMHLYCVVCMLTLMIISACRQVVARWLKLFRIITYSNGYCT